MNIIIATCIKEKISDLGSINSCQSIIRTIGKRNEKANEKTKT